MEHIPVLLTEALEALAVRPDGVYVDGTFGRGGHSRGLLARLGPAGRLIALDRDPTAIVAGQTIGDARFTLVHARFAELASVLDDLGVTAVDGVLLDIGVSSPQLDEAARGMSFRQDAPLDMRMDTSRGDTVAQWLARADEADIKEVIRDYGEERFASAIAKAIVAARGERPVDTTYQLAQIVASAVRTREAGQHPATRSFQALRIFINKELEELSLVLPQALEVLKPAGRLAVICFHSLEDRIVKRFMADQANPPQPPRGMPLRADQLPKPKMTLIARIRAGTEEIARNPRARSATLRVAEKVS
ncbi:MAG: 16S rRNA (cytosine(1402)-N(4))-methyltransferase RsmH [Methyloversatilis sp.]|nr:16S rRNA (cytosine(1402)-N(4))-methyltransferase RsmH [Methyloversatilis sp.]MBP6192851.1 16S rRNA (cytosine(1402)-N(4))-methyltransferase RsmH [Methyloversatilis sp.]MBP9116487.1 16S rRNA (cytosine(1402)-N(4))-methyltransferase RsmH [Methyloversatilis sp.]